MTGTKQRFKSRPAVTARELALDVLVRVDQQKAYSNIALNQALQKANLFRGEAGLATELVYGTMQRLNTIDYLLARFLNKGMNKLEPWVRWLLRLSLYQIHFLDRIPPHAAVNEAVTIAARKGHKGISGMVNAVLRNILRHPEELQISSELPVTQSIALTYSHPEWMVSRWIQQFGEGETRSICESNNNPPHTSIRVNRLRISPEQLLLQLSEHGYSAKPSELAPDGIVIEAGGNMALTSWYKDGLISIQDESSMLVARIVEPLPGMKVLDCCAAPGGKTAHIAELMNDQGTIIAYDIHEHKKQLIEDQAERLGLQAIQAMVGDARQLAGEYDDNSFDRILLDAPCSGLGVIRRKPDVKWTKQESDIKEIREVQDTILHSIHRLLKPGGLLIYSTCTLEYEENQAVILKFLGKHPEFTADIMVTERLPILTSQLVGEGMVQILPHQYQSDGFFITRLYKQVL
jgi:16S rRNA (cytosine967-C5)-methyltransferase